MSLPRRNSNRRKLGADIGKEAPMCAPANILVVDDEPGMLLYMREVLELEGYLVSTAVSGIDALKQIHNGLKPDLVFLDLVMPGLDGIQVLEQLRVIDPHLKVVFVSGVTDAHKVAQAIRLGAQDYLTKPLVWHEMNAVMRRCFSSNRGELIESPASCVEDLGNGNFFLAVSPALCKIRSQIDLLAKVPATVLLLGETGTGKEVLARLIHKVSPRANRPFLKVNCAAVPAELLESELFGYEPGAFTGAVHAKPGKFELCDKGTIFLDEIGEMPPPVQAKLLQVLEDQRFSRLGSNSIIQVDVRILAATNMDIQGAMTAHSFRRDLYYRLNAFILRLPPLRERKEEIPFLLKHLMGIHSERYVRTPLPFGGPLMEACMNYSWPGNVRELENFVKRYLVLGDESLATAELTVATPDVRSRLRNHLSEYAASRTDESVREEPRNGLKSLAHGAIEKAEAEAIATVLLQTNWNRTQAAVALEISYRALLYKIRRYDLQQPRNYA
jgi:two-component system response regulator AtoC